MKRKLLSLLVLLITGVTGAWAQDTYTIVFTVGGYDFNYGEQTLPYTKKSKNSFLMLRYTKAWDIQLKFSP